MDIVGIFPIFFEMSEERRGRGYRNPRLRQNPVLLYFMIRGGGVIDDYTQLSLKKIAKIFT